MKTFLIWALALAFTFGFYGCKNPEHRKLIGGKYPLAKEEAAELLTLEKASTVVRDNLIAAVTNICLADSIGNYDEFYRYRNVEITKENVQVVISSGPFLSETQPQDRYILSKEHLSKTDTNGMLEAFWKCYPSENDQEPFVFIHYLPSRPRLTQSSVDSTYIIVRRELLTATKRMASALEVIKRDIAAKEKLGIEYYYYSHSAMKDREKTAWKNGEDVLVNYVNGVRYTEITNKKKGSFPDSKLVFSGIPGQGRTTLKHEKPDPSSFFPRKQISPH